MARKFQGYARGRGFSARNAGSAAVSRIQEQGNKVTSGLKEQLSRKRALDRQYVSDLDANFRRGQQIQDEIKRFDDKVLDLQQRNIEANQATALENIKTEGANQARVYEQLSELSETLGKSGVDIANAIEEAANKGAASEAILNLKNRPTPVEREGEEQLFKANAQTDTSLVKSVTEDGMPIVLQQEYKKASPYAALRSTDARVVGAIDEWKARASYDDHGDELVYDILDRYNLWDVRPSRLYEFALKVQESRSAFKASNRRQRAIDLSYEIVSEKEAHLINNPSQQNARDFFQILRTHTIDGRGPIGLTGAHKIWWKTLENPAFTDEQIDSFMDMPLRDENGNELDETWFDRYGDNKYVTLMNNRKKAHIAKVDQQSDLIRAEQDDNFNKAREAYDQALAQGPIDDPTPYIAELDDLDLRTEQRNRLSEHFIDNSNLGREMKELDRLLQYADDNGQPMEELFRQTKGKTRAKWKSRVAEVKNDMEAAGVSDTENRKRLLKQGKLRLNIGSVDKIHDTSLDYATDDRLAKVQKRRQELMRINQMDYASANKQAMAEELDLIKSSNLAEYKPEGATTGDGSTHNYYGYYSPGGGYFTNVVQANKHQALQAVRARPESLKDVFLAPTSYFASVYDSIGKKQPIPQSDLFDELHKAYPDALQLQLNKYTTEMGLTPVTIPLTQNQYLAANAEDQRLKQFALHMDTIAEERIYPVAADPLARSHPRFRSDVVNQRRSIMEIPAVEGGITGLTVQDYDELAFIASAEAGPGDDIYLVAATALNRLASGKYGNSLYDIARAEGQYEAVYTGKAYYDPALAKEFASPAGQRKLHGMLILLDGRTDFKGQSQLHNRHESDIMVHPKGNFAHRAGETPNSGVYTGPIDYSFRRFLSDG